MRIKTAYWRGPRNTSNDDEEYKGSEREQSEQEQNVATS